MIRKAVWIIGMLLLLAPCVAAQSGEPIEKLPLPVKPPVNLDKPADGAPQLILEEPRRTAWFYVEADYLYWWVNHQPAPILLTTAPNNGLNANGLTGGILGQPGTQTLVSGDNLGYPTFSGMRVKAGVNLDSDGFWTVEASGFMLPKRSINLNYGGRSDGTPLLTIPFLDAASGQPSALDLSAQDANGNPFLLGGVGIHADLQTWGYEANVIAHSIRTAERSVDLLVGFRALSLDENLAINQTIVPTQDGNITVQFPTTGQGAGSYFFGAAGNPVYVNDFFGTRNQFYGPQLGTRFRWDLGRWTADITAKVAVGVTHEQANIEGSTTATLATNPNTGASVANLITPGGMFALQNNIGTYSQNQFTVVPEIGANLSYAVTSWLHIHAGYSALYWSNVARPGAQIDSTLNSKLIPTGALLPTATSPTGSFVPGSEQGRPYFAFHDTAFWAQGVSFGVEIRY
jgi:hypothetical protein